MRNQVWEFSSVVTVTLGVLTSEAAASVIAGHSAADLFWEQGKENCKRQDGKYREPNPGPQKRDKTSVEMAAGTSGPPLFCPGW